MHLKSLFLLAKTWISFSLKEEKGAVAWLFAIVIFLGIGFTGISLDYSMYIRAAHELKSKIDQATLAGGIACRQNFIRLRSTGASPTLIAIDSRREAENKANWTFGISKSSLPDYVNNIALTTTASIPLPDPTKLPEECLVSINYSGTSQNFIASIFGLKGFPVVGSSVSKAILDQPPSQSLEIDFLVDVSGSMSTIADTRDRDLVMYLTHSIANYSNSSNGGGCLFFCHMRRALLPEPTSRRILDAIAFKVANPNPATPYNVVANYNELKGFRYDGGLSNVNIKARIPSSIKTYRYIGNTQTIWNTTTTQNAQLIMLDDFLKAFNIRLKSEIIYEDIIKLLDSIKTSLLPSTMMAFHTFSGNAPGGVMKTVLNQKPLDQINYAADLPFHSFDYMPDPTPGFFPGYSVSSNKTIPDMAPRIGSASSDSVPYTSVQGLPGYELPGINPDTFLPQAITELATLFKTRPVSNAKVTRVAIILTDGIINPTTLLDGATVCKRLKDEKVTVMVIHSYYRLQPGHVNVQDMARRWGRVTNLTVDNVDQADINMNNGDVGDSLRACASPSPNPTLGGENVYYFPAFDPAQLQASFQELILALAALKLEKPPVIVID